MYYVIEKKYDAIEKSYASYNQESSDVVLISTKPAITNSSKEEKINGWCGTTNDWTVYAHGEYMSIEEAMDAIREIFGDVRSYDEYENDNIVKAYLKGKFIPMSEDESIAWSYESIESDVLFNTSDEEIKNIFNRYENVANTDGYTLSERLLSYMRKKRDELHESTNTRGN